MMLVGTEPIWVMNSTTNMLPLRAAADPVWFVMMVCRGPKFGTYSDGGF